MGDEGLWNVIVFGLFVGLLPVLIPAALIAILIAAPMYLILVTSIKIYNHFN